MVHLISGHQISRWALHFSGLLGVRFLIAGTLAGSAEPVFVNI